MATLVTFARYEVAFVLAALAAIVAYQILTGRITTRGVLSDKAKDGSLSFSPARLQLFMFTLGTAAYVLSKVFNSVATDPIPQFPEIDPNVLVILGGSHALYLGAKKRHEITRNHSKLTLCFSRDFVLLRVISWIVSFISSTSWAIWRMAAAARASDRVGN